MASQDNNTQPVHTANAAAEQLQPLPLPPPLPAPETDGDAAATTVDVNGPRVSLLDKLGPAVVNADGTMSRIANWAEMTEVERRNTIRVLGARNKLRLDALREGEGQDGAGKE